MTRMGTFVLCASAAMLLAGTAGAESTPEKTLEKCQKTVGKEVSKYGAAYERAVGGCLDEISRAVIGRQAEGPRGEAADAGPKCAKGMRKLVNTAKPEKELGAKLKAKIGKACDPDLPDSKVKHTEGDIKGGGGGLTEQIEAAKLDSWCSNFGGDGAIDDDSSDGTTVLDEWVSCLTAAAAGAARHALATKYPRMLDWLNNVKIGILALDDSCGGTCASCERQEVIDACSALEAVEQAVDGETDDDTPEIACGPAGGLVVGTDPILPATGQTTCYDTDGAVISCTDTGQDGDTKAGAALSFTDNVDGTITDDNTGLMWEKKSDDGGLHDWNNCYDWSGHCSGGGTACQTDGDCPGVETCTTIQGCGGGGDPDDTIYEWLARVNAEDGTGFAGHSDWRIPNHKELVSILNLEQWNPAVSSEFNTGCTPGCTVLTCSCTYNFYYWSSTSYTPFASGAWSVNFNDGFVSNYPKSNYDDYVRAVRGGL